MPVLRFTVPHFPSLSLSTLLSYLVQPPDRRTILMTAPTTINRKANKARLDNRWGCSVGHALRNFNPPSRFHAHSRPGGASA